MAMFSLTVKQLKYCDSIKNLGPQGNVHSQYLETVSKADKRTYVTKWCHNKAVQLDLQKRGSKCLLHKLWSWHFVKMKKIILLTNYSLLC